MKCLVCGKEYDNDNAKCPICKFPRIIGIGDVSEEQRNEILKSVAKYREKYIGDTTLSIIAYEWAANQEETLELKQRHALAFGKCIGMKPGNTYWLDEPFARITGDKVNLVLAVEKSGREATSEINVSLNIPKGAEFWYVGVSMEEGYQTCRLHLKTSQQECVSEPIAIL